MRTNALHLCLALATLVALSGNWAIGDDKKTDKKTEKKKSDDTSKVLAVVGGDIHTVTGRRIRQGTILIEDGKILEVGQNVEVPKGATIIDATGKTITPGFVAISMRGVGIRTAPKGNDKLADALDPYDRNLKYSLGVGITSGCIELSSGGGRRFGRPRESEPEEYFPGLETPIQEYVTESMLDYGDQDTALCPCCGLPILPTEPITATPPAQARPRKMAVVKMSFGNLDAMLLKENVFYSPNPGALNGALARHNWRRDMKKARKEIEEKKKAEKDKAKTKPAAAKKTAAAKPGTTTKTTSSKTTSNKPAKTTARKKKSTVKPEHLALLNHEVAMRIRANTVDEISDMVDLAAELGYDLVIEGGIEAWMLPEKLSSANVGVIYTPRQRRAPQPGRETSSGSFIESPRIFQESGVPFAIAALSNSISMGGLAGRDLSSLPLEAAFAVRGGASQKTSLEALTITPARMLGVDDRIGSIEKGKDADLLILNGDPLDYRTYVEQAIVSGKVAYDRSKDRVYPLHPRTN